jgi:soluble lytic murein transglycosylase
VKLVPRRLPALIALTGIVVAVLVAMPLVRRAIQHFTLPLQYAAIIRQQAHAKHLEPALVAAVIYAETRFRPRTSSTGALGLMQIEPATAKFLAHRSGATTFTVADLATPQVNIAYGAYYIRYLLNLYDGNLVMTLAAYNGGETNVDNWVTRVRAAHQRFTVDDIPISETRLYVIEVMAKQQAYRSQYAKELGYA